MKKSVVCVLCFPLVYKSPIGVWQISRGGFSSPSKCTVCLDPLQILGVHDERRCESVIYEHNGRSADDLIDFVFPPALLNDPIGCSYRRILAPLNQQIDYYNQIVTQRASGKV